MKPFFTIIFFVFSFSFAQSQQTDTTQYLNEIIVKGFENNKTALKTPTSLNSISYTEIQRYNNSGPLPILNAKPGIRMEERSPGSYRLSIRGSSVRSPYGVRNVKVYWNGIPLTDANGSTYFNQVDFNSLGNVEILKGPASSIFGAGYGGVVSLNTKTAEKGLKFTQNFQLGSFATHSLHSRVEYASEKVNLMISGSNLKTDGYREHSAVRAPKLSFSGSYTLNNKHTISLSALNSFIDYKTPGGLTLAQMQQNRKASRPATPTLPSSKEQNASITQDLYVLGLSHNWKINTNSNLSNSIFYIGNKLTNPFITSYEDRSEKTLGYRSVYKLALNAINITAGIEGIFTNSDFDVAQNNKGTRSDALYFTNLKSSQLTHFAQLEYALPYGVELTAGISYNYQRYTDHTFTASSSTKVKETPSMPWTPRIALLKTLNPKTSIYYSFSNGYSAPTAQEITANFENSRNIKLIGERGVSHEIGFKTSWTNYFKTEIAAYNQLVKDALIRKVLDNGGEYFENSGKIVQNGIEIANEFHFQNQNHFIRNTFINLNFTLNDYIFGNYFNEGVELKNKTLPGTFKTNLYLAARVVQKNGIYLYTDLNYLSKTPLNNANTIFADETLLSTLRLGWQTNVFKSLSINLYGGIENLFNNKYSLGYDFNAFGGRFYNPSPIRNYNGGLNLSFKI